MKKAFLFFAFLFVLAGCKEPYIGMSEQEFKKSTYGHIANQVDAAAGKTVYQLNMAAMNEPTLFKYFYFVDGKLVEIHQDAPRVPDVIIEHRSTTATTN